MYWVDVINQVLIFALLAMSLNMLLGYMGQVSVAHAAFAAIGGYAAGYLSAKSGTPEGWALLIGMGGAFVIGVLISVPALLLSSEFVILLTLAVQTIILVLITSIPAFGGLYGLTDLPSFSLLGQELLTPSDWLWPLVGLTVIVFVLLNWIGESPYGRVLRGVREDELATQSLGKNVYFKKVVMFGLTSAIAAMAGALLVYYNGIVAPGLFGFDQSILIVAMVVLGGRGNLVGSIVGAVVVIGAQPFFEKVIAIEPEKASLVRLLAFGALLIVVLLVRPKGLVPEGRTLGALLRRLRPQQLVPALAVAAPVAVAGTFDGDRAPAAEQRSSAPSSDAGPRPASEPAEPVVRVTDVRKAFGGIKAVDGLSFELAEGRVTGLIGPNGAGKTTVFNLLTGAIVPDTGTVELAGQDITGWPIDRVARDGMVRSFQDVRVFQGLTVLDNVRMAVPDQRGERLGGLLLTPWRVLRDNRRVDHAALEQLEFVGLAGKADVIVSDLPFGEQKLVALARILAAEARVLLLDEPASGIDAEWVDRMVEIILRLRDRGLTVCIVEHNLHVVERVADHVYFMEAGRISANGTMQDLVDDERLVEVYFGQP